MKKNIAPKARKENLVVQELNGEVLIYDLNKDKAFCLNETSSLVWQLCNGEKSVSEISESIGRKLNSPANEDLVWLALDQLKKENLIENKDELVSDFGGMTRREVVKKIGLGSVIALPVVMSLLAPNVSAQTSICGASNGATCACADGTAGNANCGMSTCTGANCLCRNITCNGSGMQCMGTCSG